METKIPVQFLVLLLILNFSIAFFIMFQTEDGYFKEDGERICEEGSQYSFLGPKWESFPIDFYVSGNLPAALRLLFLKAIDSWESLIPTTVFNEVSNESQAELTVFSGFPSGVFAIGETQLFGNDEFLSDGLITSAQVIFASYLDFDEIELSCELLPFDFAGPFDFESVAVHELGHVLGLGHTIDEFTTMNAFYSGSFMKTLTEGDIQGFKFLYA